MPTPTLIDWTVDQLLSGVKTMNARMESQQNTIKANRATYTATLRSLPAIADINSREALRSKLGVWIHSQVAVENRFNDLARNFTTAKAKVKSFLQSSGVTPPSYLGAIQIAAVPAAVWGAIAVGLAAIATIAALNSNQTTTINGIRSLVQRAEREKWSAADTAEALRAFDSATKSAPKGDPLGLANVLEKALPVLVIGGLLFLFGPMLQRKMSRA